MIVALVVEAFSQDNVHFKRNMILFLSKTWAILY